MAMCPASSVHVAVTSRYVSMSQPHLAIAISRPGNFLVEIESPGGFLTLPASQVCDFGLASQNARMAGAGTIAYMVRTQACSVCVWGGGGGGAKGGW